MKLSFGITIVLPMVLMSAACKDPAKDKPKAGVGEASSVSAAVKGAEQLTFSSDNSTISFVGSKVTGSHNGKFEKFSGKIDLAPEGIQASRVTIDIETASITADDPKLTGHLKSADFFDVQNIPKATFVSTQIVPKAGSEFTVTGNLTLHGVTKAITFPANIVRTPTGVHATSEFSLNRKDFGLTYPGKPDDLIRDNVAMKLDINAARQQINAQTP